MNYVKTTYLVRFCLFALLPVCVFVCICIWGAEKQVATDADRCLMLGLGFIFIKSLFILLVFVCLFVFPKITAIFLDQVHR